MIMIVDNDNVVKKGASSAANQVVAMQTAPVGTYSYWHCWDPDTSKPLTHSALCGYPPKQRCQTFVKVKLQFLLNLGPKLSKQVFTGEKL